MFLKCHSEFMFKVEVYGNIFNLESSGNCVLYQIYIMGAACLAI